MKKIFLLAVAALALAACDSNDDDQLTSQKALQITATIGESSISRASDDQWAPGDRIGISSTIGTIAEPYVNLKYITKNGDGMFSGETPLFFYKPMVLKAYYPFNGSEGTPPGTDGVISDKTTPNNQTEIDFLFASVTDIKAADPNVNFTFAHKMSKLTFTFVGTEEFKDEEHGIFIPEVRVSDMVSYEIEGLVLNGTFDTTTGDCTVNDEVEAEILKINLTDVSVTDRVSLAPLIVFPQKPGNSSVKLHVYTDELNDESNLQHYICPLTFGDGELKPGNSYNYTVKITKVGLELKEMKIDDWNVERDVNVTATIDGGWKPEGQH